MQKILSFILLFTAITASAQSTDKKPVTLVRHTFFDCFTLDIPDNLVKIYETPVKQTKSTVEYENEKDSVDLNIRRRPSNDEDLDHLKSLNETFATDLYKGTVQKDEIRKINGRDVLTVLVTGHWNDDPQLSTWLRVFVISRTLMYQILIRFPNNYPKYPEDLLNKMINSVSVCP